MQTSAMQAVQAPWHVLGAGAIGGLWACRLAQAGHTVTLLNAAATAPTRELMLLTKSGQVSHVFNQCAVAQAGDVSSVLVATKAPVTASALAPLLPQLGAGTVVVLLQNGMGVDEAVHILRPDVCLLVGITTDGVWRRDRNTLVQAAVGTTWIGAYLARDSMAAQRVANDWAATGAQVVYAADIRQRRWEKLAMNCAINPLTALYHCRNGELLKNPEALSTMNAVCVEVAAVMQAEGLTAEAQALFRLVCAAAEKTGDNISSMRADVEAGRETEIAFLNGYLLARANHYGLTAPANAALLASIQALNVAKPR